MKKSGDKSAYPFLQDGDEISDLILDYDWSQTLIDTPDHWPQSLRTILAFLLHSPLPMFLVWDKGDLISFYNNAFRFHLANQGMHPVLGKTGREAWPEIWDFLSPCIEQVMASGKAVSFEDRLVPFSRNGKTEELYWTLSCSPVYNDEGAVGGTLVSCTETSGEVLTIRQLEESKHQLEQAVEAAELGIWDLNLITRDFKINDRLRNWMGLQPGEAIEPLMARELIAEKDKQRVTDAIACMMQYASGGYYDIEYTIIHPVTRQERLVRAKGRAWFGEGQTAYRINGMLQDITAQKAAQEGIRAAQHLADVAIEGSGLGIFSINTATGQIDYSPAFAFIITGDPGKKNLTRNDFLIIYTRKTAL